MYKRQLYAIHPFLQVGVELDDINSKRLDQLTETEFELWLGSLGMTNEALSILKSKAVSGKLLWRCRDIKQLTRYAIPDLDAEILFDEARKMNEKFADSGRNRSTKIFTANNPYF